MASPREDKLAKALAGIVGVGGVVGVGSLLLYGGYKLLCPSGEPGTTQILEEEFKDDERKNTQNDMSSGNPTNLEIMPPSTAPDEQWEGRLDQINKIAVSLIKNPIQDCKKVVANITQEDLKKFALTGLEL